MTNAADRRRWLLAAETLLATALLLLGWQLASLAHVLPTAAVPAPLAIARQFWPDRALYGQALLATLQPVVLGLVIGEAAALVVGAWFVLSPRAERALRGVGVVLYALPPITLTPLLSVLLRGEAPQVILAAIGVYFPALTATLIGLRQVDRRTADLVALYGGGRLELLWRVRTRAALPTVAAGLRMGAPAAVLGAIVGEFGGGRPGLGAMLLSTMGAGNPARTWGVALVATMLSIGLYALFSLGTARLRRGAVPSLLALSSGLQESGLQEGRGRPSGAGRVAAGTLVSIVVPLLTWQVLPEVFGISPILLRTPIGVLRYLFGNADGVEARQTLWVALGQSLPLACAGLACGVFGALLAALGISLHARTERLVMPPLLFLQSVPLVVLIPAIVLLARARRWCDRAGGGAGDVLSGDDRDRRRPAPSAGSAP